MELVENYTSDWKTVLFELRHETVTGFCFNIILPSTSWSRAGVVQWYSAGLGDGWPDDRGVRVPVGVGNFSPHHRIQTGSGAYPASSYPMGTRGSFPGG
jgi:hypothetical protein